MHFEERVVARFGVGDLGGFLSGSWQLTRTVHDANVDGDTTFSGTASFASVFTVTPAAVGPVTNCPGLGELHYEEVGIHQAGQRFFEARRRYRYVILGSSSADVLFENGHLFHHLDLSNGSWMCQHHCGADVYEGEFVVMDSRHWTSTWRVNGPQKNLVLQSDYTRLPPVQ